MLALEKKYLGDIEGIIYRDKVPKNLVRTKLYVEPVLKKHRETFKVVSQDREG